MSTQNLLVLGLMSGTSLDGLDMALCEFTKNRGKWGHRILLAQTKAYPPSWKERLSEMPHMDTPGFWKAHIDYGHYIGELARGFIDHSGIKPQLISSHGHTIFHQPGSGFTMQAGDGAAIAAATKLPVVSDFRSADVAMQGQGAPLVPLGDSLLFQQYKACLNLGGFSNVSMDADHIRIAFDICPANIVLNRLANKMGKEYDTEGIMARQGEVDITLLNEINSLAYYSEQPPKSLGREWLESEFLPLVFSKDLSVHDLLRTCIEHIGYQVGASLDRLPAGKVLITGGGAHNTFLVDTIRKYCRHDLILPDKITVDFKEALVFAFLGALRWSGEINILSSVTGCKSDHSGGSIYDLFPE